MKNNILLTVLLAGLSAAAQEIVPRADALKAAFIVSADLKQMLATPIPTDPDVKRPVALSQGDRGVLVLPECKLSAETLAKAGKEVVPVGQLWMRGLNLQGATEPPTPEKLLPVTVSAGDKTVTVFLCALGVRKDADGKLELLIYGNDKEPIQRVALKPASASSSNPIELTGQLEGGGARLTLELPGKQTASFMVLPN